MTIFIVAQIFFDKNDYNFSHLLQRIDILNIKNILIIPLRNFAYSLRDSISQKRAGKEGIEGV